MARLVVLFLLFAGCAVVHGIGFNLGGGSIKCISDEISRATTLVGTITSDSPEKELSGVCACLLLVVSRLAQSGLTLCAWCRI